jgi:hypothetical protein
MLKSKTNLDPTKYEHMTLNSDLIKIYNFHLKTFSTWCIFKVVLKTVYVSLQWAYVYMWF